MRTDSDRERHLAAIDSDLGEIDELIQELLLVDRLNGGAAAMPAQAVDMLAAVQDEVDRRRGSRPLIEVSVECDPGGRQTVIGERLFRRVVRNLVSNALRHAKTLIGVSIARAGGTVAASSAASAWASPSWTLTIVDSILRAVGGSLRVDEASSGGASIEMAWPCDCR